MKYKLSIHTIQEYGQRKDSAGNPHQEDSMFPLAGHATPNDRLFIVCDGMGGHDAGEVASAAVCEAMSQYILNGGGDPQGKFSDETFLGALDAAFKALDERDTGAEKKMGTTMTFLKLHDEGATVCHMGDSRVYQIRPGKTAADTKVVFVTTDHSLVNDLIRIGELTPEEAVNFRRKNVITRAMQPAMDPRPKAEIAHITDIRPGDYFYMCTDGMLENMTDAQLCYHFSEQAGDDARKVSNLRKATVENRDNHTATIVHVLDVLDDQPQPASRLPGGQSSTPRTTTSPTSSPRTTPPAATSKTQPEKSATPSPQKPKAGQPPKKKSSSLGPLLIIFALVFCAAAVISWYLF